MRLRTILLVAVLSLAAACGEATSATTAAPAGDGPATPVALWGAEGGFVTPTANVLRPPRVVLYGDGLVVADASRQLRLTDAETGGTVAAMERYLTGQPPTARPSPGAPSVADVPTTVLAVRGKDGKMREVRAEALEQVAEFYPRELMDAKKLMESLAARAGTEGTAYTAPRVRMVAEGVDSVEGKPARWPAKVPEPDGPADPVWRKDLDGEAASALARAVPAGLDHGRPIFKTASGKVFVLSWRYLLPDE
ncbi:hypothetical protein [Microbispora triticiradicis]|uniref:Lipoprotein n=2 Tax=Microbispora TaxID=2005 RepID=A0ABY3LR08_9ACTN|nr:MULTISPECIES: hypothetical protein [Microbispora]TLP57920.1 hypothetical protein FED44_20425 [Microbispora fusca]TYB50674.1 hypothetical protein FXF59_28040 [Microbispora tritici]